MPYNNILKLFLILGFFLSFNFTSSYSLTESVDLFGEVNSVDLVLNDIWIEPENPRNGEWVTIRGSVYNTGVIPSGEVSDVVTVGFLVNGELLEINLLDNILPGIENGVEISSGPIFHAIPGNHIVTGIVNYHDTLSHLRDNPENNIIQKIFQIGTEAPSIINFDVYQQYDEKTKKQHVRVQGELTDIFHERLENQEIIIDIEEIVQEKIITDAIGQFSFNTDMPFKDEIVKISVYLEENSFLSTDSQMIFPIKINTMQSALALEILPHLSKNNLKNSTLTLVFFQDSYDNMFIKKSIDGLDKQNLMIGDFILTILPSNHEYITEVYIDGRLLDAFQNYFPNNAVIKKEISISESAQVQFRIIDELGEPQNNVTVENWVYSTISDEDGFTDWIKIIPTFTANEPYVAKATFPNGEVVWSEPFLIDPEEKRVIQIIQRGNEG